MRVVILLGFIHVGNAIGGNDFSSDGTVLIYAWVFMLAGVADIVDFFRGKK